MRIRILQVLEATTGGTRRHLADLVDHLDPERFELAVACATRRDPAFVADAARWRAHGIPITVLPMVRAIHPALDAAAFAGLLRLLRARPVDLVHTHSSKAGMLGRWAAAAARVPAVIHTPHVFPFEMDAGPLRRGLYRALERTAARVTDRIVCVARAERDAALAQRIAPAEKLVVIENGIALPASGAAGFGRAEARRLLELPPDVPIVGTVGRCTAQKRQDDLIRAAAALARERPDLVLAIVGDGPLQGQAEALGRALGLGARLRIVPPREDVADLYGAFDVFALPSLWEGLPYSLLEAMAAGCPAVVTRVGGMPDAVEDGAAGLVVPPRDPAALAAAIARLLADRDLAGRLAARARAILAQRFRRDDMLRQLGELYVERTDARRRL